MKYQIIGKNIVVTKGISDALIKKLSRMDKYFLIDDDVECRAVVRTYKNGGQKVEITIFTNMMTFRAEVVDADLYAAFDLAIDKLEGQMRKLKTRQNGIPDAEFFILKSSYLIHIGKLYIELYNASVSKHF